MWVARPMACFVWLFKPFIVVINGAANATLRVFGIKPANGRDHIHSEDELRMIITASGAEHGGTLRGNASGAAR